MQLPRAEPDYTAVSKKVDEEFACKHTHNAIRKKLAADGAISIWHQCDRCGQKVGIAIKKASMTPAQIDTLPVWETQIESRFYAQKKQYFERAYAAEKKRCSDVWHRAYEQYLQTPEWQHKRQLVLLRAQGICEGCREAESIDVHHLHYDAAGHEFLFQLVALCRKCHERWHGHGEPSASSPPATQSPPSPVQTRGASGVP